MDVISAVKNRRSVRNFKTDQIPKNVLEEIFDAARWAPSWGNTQPCEVFVLTGKPLDEFRKANYEKKRTNAPATPDIKTPTFWPDAQKMESYWILSWELAQLQLSLIAIIVHISASRSIRNISKSLKEELQKINQGLMSYHDEDTRADKNRWLYYSRHTEKRCNGI